MSKYHLHRVDMVIVPRRGRTRTYSLNPITIGPDAFRFYEILAREFEKWAKKDSVPDPSRRRRRKHV